MACHVFLCGGYYTAKTHLSIIHQLESVFCERGPSCEILTDNDTAFCSWEVWAFAYRWDVYLRFRCMHVSAGNEIRVVSQKSDDPTEKEPHGDEVKEHKPVPLWRGTQWKRPIPSCHICDQEIRGECGKRASVQTQKRPSQILMIKATKIKCWLAILEFSKNKKKLIFDLYLYLFPFYFLSFKLFSCSRLFTNSNFLRNFGQLLH